MFGEDDSESPRVPSPWESLISTPVSSSPGLSSSPLASTAVIPKLVPENDDGNVEYKLQLLSPSPARFARLVTQLKWRLLEGGGQAYYELGVADSGALVGLPRAQLEQSLETLEMMAGEIGASVIVVKEIEVPRAMADYAVAQAQEDHRRVKKKDEYLLLRSEMESESSASASATEDDLFSMDISDSDSGSPAPQLTIELEISSVFKPRPVRTKAESAHLSSPEHNRKRAKAKSPVKVHKKSARERKKEKNRQAIDTRTGQGSAEAPAPETITHGSKDARSVVNEEADSAISRQTTVQADDSSLVAGLAALHVSVDDELQVVPVEQDTDVPSITLELTAEPDGDDDCDDVFPTPVAPQSIPHVTFAMPESEIKDISTEDLVTNEEGGDNGKRVIVEALVVRKLSLEEGFLDFGGFSLVG